MREIKNPLLSKRTTLRLGGNAMLELVVESQKDVECLHNRLSALGGQFFCIGKGSNILANDGNLPIILVKIALNNKPEILKFQDNACLVSASADIRLSSLLRFCLENGLSGLEGLCGIPGTIGGAIAMNAGSFGTETGNLLHDVTVLENGIIKTYKINELQIEYRKIKFPLNNLKTIILKANFILTRALKSVIFTRMSHNIFEKKSRQPVEAWSAGCSFKNPANGLPAGKLLEMAGFKGKKAGGMAFSSMHANFLINEGSGTARAARDLLEEAELKVKKDFGITLQKEVELIGWH